MTGDEAQATDAGATTPAGPGGIPRVVLIGPPGAGKSTVGRHLAALLAASLRDTDEDIEERAGKPVAEIFVDDGEPEFRRLERAAVARAVTGFTGVLALGGGAVLDEDTRAVLADYRSAGGTVVFLDVSLTHAAPRVGFNTSRPLLLGNPRARWLELMAARRPVYEAVAGVRIDTDGGRPRDIAREIADLVGGPAPGRALGEDAADGDGAAVGPEGTETL